MAPSPGDWYRQGEAALEAGRSQEAEAALWRCLAEQPQHGGALHLLGRLRQQQGRLEDAIRLQRSSVRWDPGLGWNAFALAELLEQRQDWQEACGAMAAAAAQLPGEPWIARRRHRLEGLAALGGERLRQGLGPASYRYWCRELEPPLPLASGPGADPPPDLPPDPLPGWLVLIAADAVLRPGALAWIAAELERRAAAGEPPPDGFYADEDLLSPQGERHSPWFKPGWQPEAFWSMPWLEGLSGWRRDWLQCAGLPPPPAAAEPGEARFAWQLRALEAGPRLLALPRVLVHRRALPLDPAAEQRAGLLLQHLQRLGEAVSAVLPEEAPPPAGQGCFGFRLQWALPAAPPLLRVIVPSRDRPDLLAACLEGLAGSLGPRLPLALEVEVVDNGSRLQATAELRRRWAERPGLRARWHEADGPFNWSALNNGAARRARGELLLFLNNDVWPVERGGRWLEALAAQALRPAVGAAGALLLGPEGLLQHAGVLPGLGADGCAHPYRGLPPDHGVHRGRSRFLSAWPAVTGACLMVRRRLFLELGGFDPALAVEGNDVDFCLRLGAAGFRQVVSPEAVLFHGDGCSRRRRGDDRTERLAALALLRRRWPQALAAPGPWWPAACSALDPDGRPRELHLPDWE